MASLAYTASSLCNTPPLSIRAIRNAIVITFSLEYNMCASLHGIGMVISIYLCGRHILYVIVVAALAEETLEGKSSESIL